MTYPLSTGYKATIGEPPLVLLTDRGHLDIKHPPKCVSAEIVDGRYVVHYSAFILFRPKNEIKYAYDMLFPKMENYSSVLIPEVNSSFTPLLGDVIFAFRELKPDTWKNLNDSLSHVCITFPKSDASRYLQFLAKGAGGMNQWMRFLSCFTYPLTEASTIDKDKYQTFLGRMKPDPTHNRLLEIESGSFTTYNRTKRVADWGPEDSQATQRPKVEK
jgi:hypothetical protein